MYPPSHAQYGHFYTYPTIDDAKLVWPDKPDWCFVEYPEGDKTTGDKGWFVMFQEKDAGGQYGKYIVTDITAAKSLTDDVERAPEDAEKDNHHDSATDSGENGECPYVEYLSDWDGFGGTVAPHSGPFWLIDDLSDDGWAYWMQPIPPEAGKAQPFMMIQRDFQDKYFNWVDRLTP